jgi:hypothetical protein
VNGDTTCSSCHSDTPQWVLDELEHEIGGLGHVEDAEILGWSETVTPLGAVRQIVYSYHTPAWKTGTGVEIGAQDAVRYRSYSVDAKGERSGGMGSSI